MARIVEKKEDGYYSTETKILEDPGKIKALSGDKRRRIMEELNRKTTYPSALADKIGISEQNMYYHIKKLRDNGLVEVVDEEFRGGSVAKFYRPTAQSFSYRLKNSRQAPVTNSFEDEETGFQKFFRPFVRKGVFDMRIVVGSPDPHGPNQVRGRDGHHGIDIAASLGRMGRINKSLVTLDVEIENEDSYKGNILLVGGPLTNLAMKKFNDRMPVRFTMDSFPYRELKSDITGKKYHDESIGLVTKTRNPFDEESFVVGVAGIRNHGTKAAVMAVSQKQEKIFGDYEGEDTWGRVIKGLDLDGDGRVDEVEILE